MSQSSSPSWIRLTISVLILGTAFGVSYALVASKKKPEEASGSKSSITISAQQVKKYKGNIGIEVSGLVVPYREVTIASQVTGKVVTKTEICRPGRFVRAGETLVVVDSKDYVLEKNRIQASLDQAKGSVEELKKEISGTQRQLEIAMQELDVQNKDYQRKKSPGLGFSAAEIDQFRRQVLTAQSAVETHKNRLAVQQQSEKRLQNTVLLQQIQLEQANINIKRCIISAPVNGVVVTEDVEENGFVQKGASVIRFEDTSRAEIKCNLRPDQLQWIKENADPSTSTDRDVFNAYRIPKVPVKIHVKGDKGNFTWTGHLDRYDGIGVDEKTKTIPCRVVVTKPVATDGVSQRALVRGMFVKIDVEFPTGPMAKRNRFFTTVPTKGLLPGKKIKFVKDDKIVVRKVEVVDSILQNGEEHVVIKLAGEGIQLGDWAVVSPVGVVNKNTKILVQDNNKQPAQAVSSKSTTDPAKNSQSANQTPKEKKVSHQGKGQTRQ